MEGVRRLIEAFISSRRQELRDDYGIDLAPDSVQGRVQPLDARSVYIGHWRIDGQDRQRQAVYNVPRGGEQEAEVVLELESMADGWGIRQWYVKELF